MSTSCLVNKYSGAPVPLRGILVDIAVHHTVSEFRMHQYYENQEQSTIETDFLFPLDPTAAVTGITLDFGEGKVVEAQLHEIEKGKKKYSDAIAAGKSAAIAKYSASEKDIIRVGLGNFPPNRKAHLIVTWHKKLEIYDLSWCVRLPTTFTPRYQGNLPLFLATGKSQKGEEIGIASSEEERLEIVKEFGEQSYVN